VTQWLERRSLAGGLLPDFQHSISVAVNVAVAVSIKTVSVQAVYAVAAGASVW